MKRPCLTAFKRTALILAAAMLTSLSACGQTNTVSPTATPAQTTGSGTPGASSQASNVNKTGYPIVNEPITITVSGNQGATPDWNDTLQVAELEKQLGIKLDCTPYSNDAWPTQFTLMLTTDTLPDLIINGNLDCAQVMLHGSEGYFLPINDYLDYAPNLAQTFSQYPAYESFMTAADGKIYGLTTLNLNTIGRVNRVFMNVNWLKNVGMNAPTTINELYGVLSSFKAQDANGNGDPDDEIPFGYTPDSYYPAELAIMSGFGIQTTSPNYILQESAEGTISLAETTENYKEHLKFMRKLYAEGLIGEDSFVQSTDEFREKMASDRIGYFGSGSAPFVEAGKPIDYDVNFVAIMGLTSELNSTKTNPLANPIGTSIKAAVSAKTQYPEAIVRLLDYFYSDTGMLAGTRGFEGVTYDYVEIDGVPGSQISTMKQPEGYASQEEFRYKKAVINGGFQIVSGIKGTQYDVIMNASDKLLQAPLLNLYGWAVLLEQRMREDGMNKVDVFPGLVYTSEEAANRSTLVTDITSYLKTAKAQFITGEAAIDTGWDTYINTLNQMGLKDALAIEQAAYDRLKK